MSTTITGEQPPRRLPTAVFIVGFGALLLVCIVLAAGLFNYESGAQERRDSSSAAEVAGSDGELSPSREPKPVPPETSLDNVNASIRTYLIADAQTARTYTGVALSGELTEQAMADTTEVSGHISRLMEQNCVDSIGLSTPHNLRVNFTGFCFSTIPPETLQRMLDFAVEEGADAIDFGHHPKRFHQTNVSMTWFVDSEQRAEQIKKTWNELRRPRAIEQIDLYVYTPENAHRVTKLRGKGDYALVDPIGGSTPNK